jgi:Nitroreductase family
MAVSARRKQDQAGGMSGSAWYDDDGHPGDILRNCLIAASAAPSIHNTQPWLFRSRGDVVDVLVDRSRQLPTLDPDGREMLVSVGAAVFNLRVAVRAYGRENQVWFMPDPSEPDLAARITLESTVAPPAGALALAEAIPRRHTNRRPFADRPVPYGTMEELAAAAELENAVLVPVDPPLRDGVLSLTRTAENQMRSDPRYRAELAAWTTPGGVGRRDAVPRQAFGPRDTDGALPLRDFALGLGAPTATVAFEPEPTLILLYTSGDAPTDWLHAGAALQRVLLTATQRGLAATPLSQLLEVPKLRALLADFVNRQVLQTVLRIGYPTTPALATPRRSLDELLIVESEPHDQ